MWYLIYLTVAVWFLVMYYIFGEFVRDEGESLKKYAVKCVGNAVWAMAWPLVAVTAAVALLCRFD